MEILLQSKTRYCKHFDICDKVTNCYKGEECPFFEHSEDFTSLRYETSTRSREKILDGIKELNFDE